MTNGANKQRDIHERIYQYVLRVLKLLASLPKTPINLIIIDQCGRAVSSVGANDQEADACESRKDFIAKYIIVKKEQKETNYWIRLTGDINPDFKEEIIDLMQEGKEILLIVSSIVNKSKNTKIDKNL